MNTKAKRTHKCNHESINKGYNEKRKRQETKKGRRRRCQDPRLSPFPGSRQRKDPVMEGFLRAEEEEFQALTSNGSNGERPQSSPAGCWLSIIGKWGWESPLFRATPSGQKPPALQPSCSTAPSSMQRPLQLEPALLRCARTARGGPELGASEMGAKPGAEGAGILGERENGGERRRGASSAR